MSATHQLLLLRKLAFRYNANKEPRYWAKSYNLVPLELKRADFDRFYFEYSF
jgi:hypothetical protein